MAILQGVWKYVMALPPIFIVASFGATVTIGKVNVRCIPALLFLLLVGFAVLARMSILSGLYKNNYKLGSVLYGADPSFF